MQQHIYILLNYHPKLMHKRNIRQRFKALLRPAALGFLFGCHRPPPIIFSHGTDNLHNLAGSSGIHKLWQSPWTWCQGHILMLEMFVFNFLCHFILQGTFICAHLANMMISSEFWRGTGKYCPIIPWSLILILPYPVSNLLQKIGGLWFWI